MTSGPSELRHDLIERLLGVSLRLNASADLTQILSAIIDAMRDLLGAERATVFQYDAASNELFTTVAHGVGAGTTASEGIRIPATAGIAGECAQKRAIINVPDAYADARFNQEVDRKTGFRTKSILAIPLVDFEGALIGVAQVLNRASGAGAFGKDEERIAELFAAQAAVAIKRGRLIEDRVLREKLQRDLQVARTIQQSSFPTAWPSVPGFDVFAFSEPADETGGDAYDVIGVGANGALITSAQGRTSQHVDRLIMLLADATGHGIGAALSVTQVRSMLRMAARLGASLTEIAAHLNHQLCADLPGGRFITAWLGEIDAATGRVSMFSAGQGPLLLYRAATDSFEEVEPDTPPFGIMDELEITERVPIVLAAGDIFLAASDGFFEAMDPNAKLFGTARVKAAVHAAKEQSSADIAAALRAAVVEFAQSTARGDDQTLVVIRRA